MGGGSDAASSRNDGRGHARHDCGNEGDRRSQWCIENEAKNGQELMLELLLTPSLGRKRQERAISVLGSLAEGLLLGGLRVGVRAPGTLLLPETGVRQRSHILTALAKLEPGAQVPTTFGGVRVARVALAAQPGLVLPDSDLVLDISEVGA